MKRLQCQSKFSGRQRRHSYGRSTFDRFVSNYVLDLLIFDDIRTILQEAWRVLTEGGLLGLTSLIHGLTPISCEVTSIRMKIHAFQPKLVGGCRPINLLEFVNAPGWKVRYEGKFSSYGVPSEVLVAEKVTIA